MEGIVGLASKAFTGPPPSNKDSKQEAKDKDLKEIQAKEDYSLSMAKETLEMLEELEKQTRNQTVSDSVEDPIQDFINNLSITGVMIAGNESQILINNQVYSKNSIINSSFELKLFNTISQNYDAGFAW